MFKEKYRPRELSDIIGSLNVTTTLETLLDKDRLPQSILLEGMNGIGKTSIAKILANKIMCGCGEDDCDMCNALTEQLYLGKDRSGLTNVYEFDLGKNRDDEFVDRVIDVFRIKGRKVIILDEIQNLSDMNMTKFLKTFENLMEDTYLIICTTEPYKLNGGIISRCEQMSLQPPNTTELSTYLESICRLEDVRDYNRPAIYMIAKSKYRVRDAIGTLGTILDLYGRVVEEEVLEYFGKQDHTEAVKFLLNCKESSPYVILQQIADIQETTGIYKFLESLKETIKDSIFARYEINQTLVSSEKLIAIQGITDEYTVEEISAMSEELVSFRGMSNNDMTLALINFAFRISNGTIFRMVSPEKSLQVEREVHSKVLDSEKELGKTDSDLKPASFTHSSNAIDPSSILDVGKVDARPKVIDNEEEAINTVMDIFNNEGSIKVIDEEE